ncbi:MAG: bifunctional DNA primase/polymerase [Hyphomicrobiales bacterium]
MLKTNPKNTDGTANSALAQALFHGQQGRRIFRLKENQKVPAETGWQKNATSDPESIKALFQKHPGMNYGIVTGADSGLVVLDVDEKKGISGSKSLKPRINPADLDTYSVRTPSGGRHFYFLSNDTSLKNGIDLLPGVDFRGSGGYIVGPGSTINSNTYVTVTSKTAQPIPESVVQLMSPPKVVQLTAKSPLAGVPEGQRDDAAFKYACKLRKLGLSHPEAAELVLAKAKNCIPPFPEEQALKCLNSAWNYSEDKILLPKAVDGADLMKMEIPEPDWIVEGLLPVGLTMLAGKPKGGKSWLSLDLALALAHGGELFQSHHLLPGRTMVLALEDTLHRLKDRMEKLGTNDLSHGDIDFYTEWPIGNSELLEEQILLRPDMKLVVVDTLALFRQKAKGNADLYSKDYEDISKLKQVADRTSVAILVVHHLRKAKSDDQFERISGTGGISGAADTLWVLDRAPDSPSASLYVRGRDVEDQVLSLQFENFRWKNIGEFEHKPSPIELKYHALLDEKPMSPKELAKLTGDDVQNVSKRLQRMVQRMMISKIGHGQYATLNSQL